MAEIEFTGFAVSQSSTVYALEDATEKHSAWVKLDSIFEGYRVSKYESESQTLTLSRDAETLRLALRDAKIADKRVELSGRILVGLSEDLKEYQKISLSSSRTTSLEVGDGVVLRIQPEVLPDRKIAYHCAFDVELRSNSKLRRIVSAPTIIAPIGDGFSMKTGGFEFSFTPERVK